jgi:hypothetical protein
MITVSVFMAGAQCLSGDCTNGIGTYLWESGDEYTGEWVSGNRTGIGVYDWKDGSYYYGYFKDGKLDGKGVYIGNDEAKTTLIGYFRDGTLKEDDNFIKTGCIIGNCDNGIGVYLWESDDVYVGQWKNENRTGYGRYDWKDGSFYTGYFKDGKLDGRGYYESAENNVMDGYFENNNFIRSATESTSSSSVSSAAKPGAAAASSSYSVETYDDVCSLLRTVIKSFDNDFKDVKGNKDEEGSILLTFWFSTVKLTGTEDADLSSGILNLESPNWWSNVILKGASYSSAKAKYDECVSDFKSCNNSCCMFKVTTDHKTDGGEQYTTSFTTSSVNGGFSSTYKDMEVRIDLKSDANNNWSVVLNVIDNSDY